MESEGFWSRDEVVILLRAWRDAAQEPPEASRSLDARVFAHFCALYGSDEESGPRSFKSVKKTRKSLLRSFRFIAVFNQNLVIARSMSALGGTNWFALPEDEQQRVVAAHYKRKPFAYIDEDMFDAVEMILAVEDRARRRLESGRVSEDEDDEGQNENASGDAAGGDAVGDDDVKAEDWQEQEDLDEKVDDGRRVTGSRFSGRSAVARALRLARRYREPVEEEPDRKSSANAPRGSSSWTREDLLALLRAWEECLDESRDEQEAVAVFDSKVFDRFQELAGPHSLQRSPTAVRLKKYSVIPSYQFIVDFDNGLIPPVGDAATAHQPGEDKWFELEPKYRAAVVQQHYQKSKHTTIEEDMLPIIERIIDKSGSMEARKPASRSQSPGVYTGIEGESTVADDNVVREPWGRHEKSLLLSAWSEAETLAQQDPKSGQLKRGINAYIFKRFCVNCGGESLRDMADVLAQKRALENTFEFISEFDREASSNAASSDEPPATWFTLRKGERKRRLLAAERPCTVIDENSFNELRWIFQVRKQLALQSTLSAPALPPVLQPTNGANQELVGHIPPRSILVWNREEVWNLLNAWTEILDDPNVAVGSLLAQTDRIFARYVELNGGTTLRTVKAVHAKRDSIVSSYHFICDFNDQKIVPPGAKFATGTNYWYALSHDEQKSVIKMFYKKVSFSYLYLDMLPAVKKLIEKTPNFENQDPTVYTKKPQKKSWTKDEMDSFLEAWYELVHVYPREATETASVFNGRLHRRFLELCDGGSKKPEVSLLTKRRVLTTTYTFIADFNRRTKVDRAGEVVRRNWFKLDDADRKKRMVTANKVTHTCTNIDVETFVALHHILGAGKPLALPGVDDDEILDLQPSWVQDSSDSTPRIASPTATMYDSVRVFVGAKRKTSSVAMAPGKKRRKTSGQPWSAVLAGGMPSLASSTATMYDSVREFIREIRRPSPKAAAGSDRQTRSTKLMKRERRDDQASTNASTTLLPLSSPYDHVSRKRHRGGSSGDPENAFDTIASLLDKQTQLLASMIQEIKDERAVEQAERRQLFDSFLRNQVEEQRRNREEQAKERELEKWRWEQYHEERRADREQNRLVLAEILRLQARNAD